MAITISVADVNGDGIGVDFAAYLANFATSYVASGRGGFSSANPDNMFQGKAYVTTDGEDGGTSVMFNARNWMTYDLATHVVSGKLDSIVFGGDTENSGGVYSNNAEVAISGFRNHKTSSSDGDIMGDLMDSNTSSLIQHLKTQSLKFLGSDGDDTFRGYGKADVLKGGAGNDTLYGQGGGDRLRGGVGDDTLNAGKGKDSLFGGAGDDRLAGGKGNDVLKAAAGDDFLIGGKGSDTLRGGAGADIFYFAKGHGRDTVQDFEAGTDTIAFHSSLFSNVSDILDHARQTDDGVVISYQGGRVLLEDIRLNQLSDSDFSLITL